jgi:pimeloyl-ACP methyl ester carboxylesterase
VQNHYPSIEIPIAPKGRFVGNAVLALARWAVTPAKCLLIFVHGFCGDNESTWKKFNVLLPQDTRLRNTDIVFFQYDAVFNSVSTSASYLLSLLDRAVMSPADTLINKTVGEKLRETEFRYDRIVIAAHSAGAVIARQALLDSLNGKYATIYKNAPIRLVFYAPAHCGAYPSRLIAIAMTGQNWAISGLGNAASYFLPLLGELDPKASTVLSTLNSDTDLLLKSGGPQQLLIAYDVLRAQNDRVVVNRRFCSDPHPPPIGGESHTSVCKPKTFNQAKYRRLINSVI